MKEPELANELTSTGQTANRRRRADDHIASEMRLVLLDNVMEATLTSKSKQSLETYHPMTSIIQEANEP
jgi:hypothetical protein